MKLQGKLISKEEKSGTSAKGKEWNSINAHIKGEKQDAIFNFFGEKSEQLKYLSICEDVEVEFYVSTKTWNGKTFNELIPFSIRSLAPVTAESVNNSIPKASEDELPW